MARWKIQKLIFITKNPLKATDIAKWDFNFNTMQDIIKKAGGKREGAGRKKKVNAFEFHGYFKESVGNILATKKDMTAFIESAVIHYEDYLTVRIVSAEEI